MKYQNCPICDKQFKVPGKQKRKYCSMQCLKIGFKEQFKGENNPNYRHGPTYCKYCNKPISRNAKVYCIECKSKAISGEDNPFFGKKHTDKTRQKMKDNHPRLKGEDNPNYGKRHSEELKKTQSEKKKESWKTLSQEKKDKAIKDLREAAQRTLEAKGNTKPERIVAEQLNQLEIKYMQNHPMHDKFFVDFFLEDGKTIIEVFGDYWHANPEVFDNLNEHQQKQVKKDKSRIAYLTKCGYNLIILWEKDLKSNHNLVKETLCKLGILNG